MCTCTSRRARLKTPDIYSQKRTVSTDVYSIVARVRIFFYFRYLYFYFNWYFNCSIFRFGSEKKNSGSVPVLALNCNPNEFKHLHSLKLIQDIVLNQLKVLYPIFTVDLSTDADVIASFGKCEYLPKNPQTISSDNN